MELAFRKDVPLEETWDLSLIYDTEEAYQADIAKLKALIEAGEYPNGLWK